MTREEDRARQLAGVHNQEALEKIAEHLHYNESIHLHDLTDEAAKVCNYCWLRAGKAILALRIAKLPIVLGRDPVQADEPVEIEAEVLHALEAAACIGDRAEVRGWRAVHISNPGADQARRILFFRSQDGRTYGAPLPAFMHTGPAARVLCSPAVARPVVTQTARYELAEAVSR
ncbi:hypothetical protein E1287_07160 [Actinomadura sp. KC06]|uniref:hypothetical protein n=1 Tax=Actinomadura sp. KC06 TaxID=2530369 RepID=UPI0010525AFF|nr:hypothetical protein [Actinomadura sp. KC06]TDD37831.1 hypothetical protein E1287_07160 [Actinomadura sp. KC06]